MKIMKKFFIGIIVILVLNITLGGLTLQYTLNYWVPKITNEKFEADFWPCVVAGVFLGEFSIPAAAITWVIESSSD
jgi:hypothetical protein